jgi:hypothetical protein
MKENYGDAQILARDHLLVTPVEPASEFMDDLQGLPRC